MAPSTLTVSLTIRQGSTRSSALAGLPSTSQAGETDRYWHGETSNPQHVETQSRQPIEIACYGDA
jgi:hypothetical protein